MKRAIKILVLLAAVGMCLCPVSAFAFKTNFHGYAESRVVLRDTTGFQYGFADDMEGVQWMQELQLDLEVVPSYPKGQPLVRFEKAFFRYRGAYDAILDLRDEYKNIREKSPADFELGRDDLKLENDLRECFADFVAENKFGDVRANLRIGRQIVGWGEADVFNLVNIVNPFDLWNKANFSNPEDLVSPLWMGRFDLNLPGVGVFDGFNLQLLAIPDIRPHVFAPLDGTYAAPYAGGFAGFAPLPVKENVKSSSFDNSEFGVRLGAMLSGSALFLYYFEGYNDNPSVDFTTAGLGYYTADHPKTRTIGYSFNKFFDRGNFVFRGEGSVTQDMPFVDLETLGTGGKGYAIHDYYQVLFAIDKSFSNLPIGTGSALSTAWQIYYNKVEDWDENAVFGRTTPEDDIRATMVLATDYMHGALAPTVVLLWDNAGAWLTQLSLNYSPDGKWYFNVTQASVFGDPNGNSAYTGNIKGSEVQFKCGYRW